METFDVIIVGSGIAGLRSAVACKENGLNVLVLEKMNTLGGNTNLSDGGVAAANTDLQEKHGIVDSDKSMVNDMLKAGKGLNDEALVRLIVTHAKEAFYWTRSIGVPYMDRVDIFGGHSLPRCYTPESLSGRTMIEKSKALFCSLGGHVKTNTYVSGLLMDDNGRISGVKALYPYRFKKPLPENEVLYQATKGVIIASGGFSADVVFRQAHVSILDDGLDTTNIASATAEVLKATYALGGDTLHLNQISLAPWTSPDEKGFGDGPKFADYVALPKGILVDPNTSTRFTNELADRKTISNAILKLGHPAIAIADALAVSSSKMALEKALKKDVVRRFDTFEQMSDAYAMDSFTLKNTIDQFNHYVENALDEAFNKPLVEAKRIMKSPFYAMRIWPKVHYTMGGLRINEHAQVLKKDGSIIEGLYAAGEVTGGIHGASRLGSLGLTDCLVMGSIAAKTLIDA